MPNLVTDAPTHVEPEIHFGEVAVKRNGNAQHSGALKGEADDAHVHTARQDVELRPARHMWREQRRIDPIVEERQVPPLGTKKNARCRLAHSELTHAVRRYTSRTRESGRCGW